MRYVCSVVMSRFHARRRRVDGLASMAWRGRQTHRRRRRGRESRSRPRRRRRESQSQTTQDGFGASVEITLALAQTTRNGVPAGNREHTLKGSISGSKMTGAVETTMFGSVASGDLDLTKM